MVSETAERIGEIADTGRVREPDFKALVGDEGWSRLHADVRRRFVPGHAATAILYRGHMDVYRSAIGVVFAALAILIGAPLPLRRAAAVPTRVRVSDDRRGGVVWERDLHFKPDAPPARIRSTKRLGATGGLLECVDGGLGMALAVFEEDGALVFESRRYFFDLAGFHIPIPAFLTPGRCRVTHTPVTPTRFRFTMDMTHPLWGGTFHQTGVFDDPEAAA